MLHLVCVSAFATQTLQVLGSTGASIPLENMLEMGEHSSKTSPPAKEKHLRWRFIMHKKVEQINDHLFIDT